MPEFTVKIKADRLKWRKCILSMNAGSTLLMPVAEVSAQVSMVAETSEQIQKGNMPEWLHWLPPAGGEMRLFM
uniref:hypothetical protein n=1 Tax=Salmonella sp. TaxID=599 RepID=UPI001CD998A4|nr:hypothetical protein [Salmonella sp.]